MMEATRLLTADPLKLAFEAIGLAGLCVAILAALSLPALT